MSPLLLGHEATVTSFDIAGFSDLHLPFLSPPNELLSLETDVPPGGLQSPQSSTAASVSCLSCDTSYLPVLG